MNVLLLLSKLANLYLYFCLDGKTCTSPMSAKMFFGLDYTVTFDIEDCKLHFNYSETNNKLLCGRYLELPNTSLYKWYLSRNSEELASELQRNDEHITS